jgi:uronate dehydrogenase
VSGRTRESDALRLAVTGAAGHVGRHVVRLLRDDFTLRLIDKVRIDGAADESIVCDIGDLEALTEALRGCDAVLHLAAVAGDGDFATEIVPKNIVGVRNAFEAARVGGVGTFVFASSGQVVLGHPPDAFVTTSMPPSPTGPYAASKLFGEALAHHYHHDHGMRTFSLRMGWFGPEFTDEMRDDPVGWCWLSPRDLAAMVVACIRSDVASGVFLTASAGAAVHWDLDEPRGLVGWEPVDRPTTR